jgi:hypothetical protein
LTLNQQQVSDECNCSQRKFLTKISNFSYLTNYCLLHFLWSRLSFFSHKVTCNNDSFTTMSIFFLASLSVKLAVLLPNDFPRLCLGDANPTNAHTHFHVILRFQWVWSPLPFTSIQEAKCKTHLKTNRQKPLWEQEFT